MLADGERGRGQIDDGLRTRADQFFDRVVMVPATLPEVAVVPDVFADADPEAMTSQLENLRAVERFEVPILVEDVVGREQGLAEALHDPSVAEEGRGVEQRSAFLGLIGLGEADERRGAAFQLRAKRLQSIPASRDKAGAEEQVARQVAYQRELRRHRQVGASGRRLAHRVGDQRGVAVQIADGRVDLQKGDFHGYSTNLYLSSVQSAPKPAVQVIFLPSSYPRPA